MNIIRGLSPLAACCAALVALSPTEARAQQEDLSLETRSAASVPSQMVLKRGKPYRVTMQVRLLDSPVADNCGRVQIFVLPGA